jgi:hypothetical protein
MSAAEGLTTCRICGAVGESAMFCDSCGAVLPQAAREAVPEAALADAAASAVTRQDLPADERARSLIIPVAESAHPEQPSPVLPGIPDTAVPTVRRPDQDVVLTGQSCPWCSTLNPLDRHFCRRCAMLLDRRPAPERLPWWRRLFDWYRQSGWRHRELPYAGERPRLRRGTGRLARWLVLAVIAVLAAVAAGTWAGAAVTDVKDHFAHRYPVFATTVTASHSDPEHPVSDLHDGFNNTWWGTGEAGDGAGVSVDAAFAQPINLLDIVITPGAGVRPDVFTAESRPQVIEVTLVRADGSSTETTITLADSPGPETFAIQGADVAGVRLTLQSAYLAQPSSATEVAIAEVEFFASSGGG